MRRCSCSSTSPAATAASRPSTCSSRAETITLSARKRAERSLVALALLATACGGGSAPAASDGRAARAAPAAEAPTGAGIELTLRTPEGQWIYVGDLRDQPVLIAVLATYDGVSQAAIVPLRRLKILRADVHVLGVLVQQEADTLADAWVSAVSPPFPVGYEPDGTLLSGAPGLAAIETVPTFIVLNARGVEVERRVGFQSERALVEMVDRAAAHAPTRERAAPPLLGTPRAIVSEQPR